VKGWGGVEGGRRGARGGAHGIGGGGGGGCVRVGGGGGGGSSGEVGGGTRSMGETVIFAKEEGQALLFQEANLLSCVIPGEGGRLWIRNQCPNSRRVGQDSRLEAK